jgi:hypothetical protein
LLVASLQLLLKSVDTVMLCCQSWLATKVCVHSSSLCWCGCTHVVSFVECQHARCVRAFATLQMQHAVYQTYLQAYPVDRQMLLFQYSVSDCHAVGDDAARDMCDCLTNALSSVCVGQHMLVCRTGTAVTLYTRSCSTYINQSQPPTDAIRELSHMACCECASSSKTGCLSVSQLCGCAGRNWQQPPSTAL